MVMAVVFVGIGSNIEPKKHIREALQRLSRVGSQCVCSHVYRTKPYGFLHQPDFLNMVVRLHTDLSPLDLLQALLGIEQQLGRVRTQKWGPRTIDLDMLFYDTIIMKTPELSLPHPEIPKRWFVLRPLMDIDPDFVHPELGETIRSLYERLIQADGQREEKGS